MQKIIFIVITFVSLNLYSQEKLFSPEMNDFQIDLFGNIFIQKEHKIIKINKSNNEQFEAVFLEYGSIKKIITKNPLRTIVFFEDSQTIIFLDQNLNKLNVILKLQNIQHSIISDIESHSNLIFLLSEISNEICIYDFKASKIKNCNFNIKTKKKEYLKLFFDDELIFLINNQQIQILNSHLSTEKIVPIEKCQKLFFSESSLYIQLETGIYKCENLDISNLILIKKMKEKPDLFWIKNDILFMIKNKILIEEKLR